MRPPLEMVTEMLGILQTLVGTRMALEVHGEVTAKRPTHGVVTGMSQKLGLVTVHDQVIGKNLTLGILYVETHFQGGWLLLAVK